MIFGLLAVAYLVSASASFPQDHAPTKAVVNAKVDAGTQPTAQIPARSKVYFPDTITPETVAAARARSAEQEQLAARKADADVQSDQLSTSEDASDPIDQLSDGASARYLSQLSNSEREVLLEAIDGTDICDNPPDIDAIRELCRNRLETRSSDFTLRQTSSQSAEERLLGEGLEDTGTPSIERVIERLARNVGKTDDFANQAIASVALGDSSTIGGETSGEPGDGSGELSPETQDLINALIQQLGNSGGG